VGYFVCHVPRLRTRPAQELVSLPTPRGISYHSDHKRLGFRAVAGAASGPG
jgi:hypothetical protein